MKPEKNVYVGNRSDLRSWMRGFPEPYVEIGCGTGAMLRQLKAEDRVRGECIGIEPNPGRAEEARQVFDHVHVSDVGYCMHELPDIGTLVLADVLEHLVNPWDVLTEMGRRIRSDGVVYASIPNIGYAGVSWPLLWCGHFTYTETGILDRTHLRFFDKPSILQMFAGSGLRVIRIEGAMGSRTRLLNRCTLHRWEHLLVGQYFVEAVPEK